MQCLRILRQISRDLIFIGTSEVKLTYSAAVWFSPQLLLFIPPSPITPYFSVQKLSLASITNGSEPLTFSKGRKLKSATLCPGRLK